MKALTVHAPAKINLFLHVVNKRRDGYHNIETVFHTISLHDDIRFLPAKRVIFSSTGLPVPRGRDNLCVRTAELLREHRAVRKGVHIRLVKRIPPGAGLGGGSSDAAACLSGLNRFWRLGLPQRELMRLASRLGSDVPFFIMGGSALGRGRGGILHPLKSRLRGWVVVAKPRFGISTALAYRKIDREKPPPVAPRAVRATITAVRRGNLAGLGVFNSFESMAVRMHPKIGAFILALRREGATQSFMTGSGSAVIGLFREKKKARQAARIIGHTMKVGIFFSSL